MLSEGRPLAARLTDAEKLHLEASQRVQRNRIHVEKANQSLAAALELLEERTMVLDRIKQEISATRAESDGASGRSLSPSASGSSQQGSAAHALTMLTNSVTHLAAVAQQQGGQVSLSMADIGQMLQAAAAAGTNAAPHDMSQVNSACPAPVTTLTAEQRQAATPVGYAPLTPDHRVRGPAYPSPSPVRSEGGRGGAGTPARPQAFSIGDGDGDASAGDGDSSFAMEDEQLRAGLAAANSGEGFAPFRMRAARSRHRDSPLGPESEAERDRSRSPVALVEGPAIVSQGSPSRPAEGRQAALPGTPVAPWGPLNIADDEI